MTSEPGTVGDSGRATGRRWSWRTYSSRPWTRRSRREAACRASGRSAASARSGGDGRSQRAERGARRLLVSYVTRLDSIVRPNRQFTTPETGTHSLRVAAEHTGLLAETSLPQLSSSQHPVPTRQARPHLGLVPVPPTIHERDTHQDSRRQRRLPRQSRFRREAASGRAQSIGQRYAWWA